VAAFGGPVDRPGLPIGETPYEQILQDREARDQPQMLMHEAHAVLAEGPGGQRQRHIDPADGEPTAGVGRVEARQNLDQRRLARAVLPEQAVDLALPDLEHDVIECLLAAEGLAEAGEMQRERRRLPALRHGWGQCSFHKLS
jgi:hypothetical protein